MKTEKAPPRQWDTVTPLFHFSFLWEFGAGMNTRPSVLQVARTRSHIMAMWDLTSLAARPWGWPTLKQTIKLTFFFQTACKTSYFLHYTYLSFLTCFWKADLEYTEELHTVNSISEFLSVLLTHVSNYIPVSHTILMSITLLLQLIIELLFKEFLILSPASLC